MVKMVHLFNIVEPDTLEEVENDNDELQELDEDNNELRANDCLELKNLVTASVFDQFPITTCVRFLPEHMDNFFHFDKNSATELISNDTHTENKTGGLLSFNTETRKSTDKDEIIESTIPPGKLTLTKESDTTEFTENNDYFGEC
ncbi:hypothetical protein QTP88_020866 [Uroleucon formosanum]